MQRLAIARAIYQDAPILLLDEATSSLDEKIEQTVLDNLSKLKNKTIIFVTHHKAVLAITDKEVAFPGKNE
jgi:ATP-binding cassette subfamily B protein